jgi:hypothetical protein
MGRPADVVERIVALGYERLEESLALMSETAEWTPLPGQPAVRGHEAIRRFVTSELRRLGPDVPEALPALVFERGQTVLVLGQLRVPRQGGKRRFTEVRPIAWLYEIEDDLVASITTYDDWDHARDVAGVPATMAPTRTLEGSLWHPAVAQPGRRLEPFRRQAARLGSLAWLTAQSSA